MSNNFDKDKEFVVPETNFSIDDIPDEVSLDKNEKIFSNTKKQKNRKISILVILAVLIVIGIISSLAFFTPFLGYVFNKDNIKVNTIQSEEIDIKMSGEIELENKFWEEPGKEQPEDSNEWQNTFWKDQELQNLLKEIKTITLNTEIGNISNTLPSEESGYTSNIDEAILENNNPNPYFSYWTYENFNSEVSLYLERLLNPTFGGWGLFQYSRYNAGEEFDTKIISDMFTENWLEKNKNSKVSEYAPVLADWESNDYNLNSELLGSGPRWFGKIESSETEFNYNKEKQQYTVNIVVNVKFTAWNKEQGKLNKDGILTLKLISNPDQKDYPRVLIDEASLKVE